MSGQGRLSALRGWTAAAVLLVAAFLVAYRVFGGFTSDDDLIILRYAERFAAGDGLTWNDGERAHALTLFLLPFFVAFMILFGVPTVFAMSAFSSAATLVAALCIVAAARREGFPRWVSGGLGAALVLFAPFSVWATAGIGGAAFAAVTGWAVLLAVPSSDARAGGTRATRANHARIAALLCVLQLVRADAPVAVAAVLLVVLLAAGREGLGAAVRRVVLPTIAFGAVFAGLQLWYFGTPVPHAAGVKVALDLSLTRVGVLYVLEFARGFFPLLLLAPVLVLLAVLPARTGNPVRGGFGVLAPMLPVLVWVLYLVWVGGDWTPGNRHFAVVLVLTMLTLVRAAAVLAKGRAQTRPVLPIGALLAVSLVTGAVSMSAPAALHRAQDERAWLEFNCAGAEAVRTLFAGSDPLLAVENVGCGPYTTGFRVVDMLGIGDIHVSKAPPKGRAVTWDEWAKTSLANKEDPRLEEMFPPAHGNGDGVYVWGREPDMILTCDPVYPYGAGCFRSWREMREAFDFPSRYRLLTIKIDTEFTSVDRYGLGVAVRGWRLWNAWVRHDDGPLGVRYATSSDGLTTVTVPPWLLTAPLVAPLQVADDGEALVKLRPRAEVQVPRVVLDAGTWDVAGIPSGVSWDLAATASCASRRDGRVVVSSDTCPVDLTLLAGESASLEGLVLTRS